jgi:N-acetyl-beta-hexosaminidase
VQASQLEEEAYQIKVDAKKILVTANTPHGIFNGLQTLLQLMRDGVMVNGCEITDWPAFAWRGYMIDVGRNFMSTELLKQQIDVMDRYKFNIFHFHFTEDIAWRLASKLYPQLTAPQNMLRNKGQYYTEAEMKQLIAYCKERYITLIPEIDMPGHSAAFTRAMGFDMQSDSGLMVIKNILKEFIETYNLPYLHIGADEVKIRNKNFIPEVTAYIQSFGKKIIGWQPGGNFNDIPSANCGWMIMVRLPVIQTFNTLIHDIFT